MAKLKPPKGKFVATVKVGPKGQIIVPKEVRDMFQIEPGDMLLLLADEEQGIGILPYDSTGQMICSPGKIRRNEYVNTRGGRTGA